MASKSALNLPFSPKRSMRGKTKDHQNRMNKYEELIGEFDQEEISYFLGRHTRDDDGEDYGYQTQSGGMKPSNLKDQRINHGPSSNRKSNAAPPASDSFRDKQVDDLEIGSPTEANQSSTNNNVSATFVKNIYTLVEREFEPKKRYSDKDWMAKNTQERP